jgi:RimJ/RimL family protein N-acetyltransferase
MEAGGVGVLQGLLLSGRLRLEAVVAADAARLYEAFVEPVPPGARTGAFRSLELSERWVGRRIEERDSDGLCSYVLRDRVTGGLVGTCGVRRGPAAAEPELGYRIAARYRRRGLATEAATAVVDECRRAGLHRVWATIRPDNVASRRVVERLGMHLAATDQDRSGPLHRYTVDL